jgi:hypothetical protein
MTVGCCGVLMGLLAMLKSRRRMFLGLFVLTESVMMRRLMVVMCGGVVVRSCLMVMLAGRVLR